MTSLRTGIVAVLLGLALAGAARAQFGGSAQLALAPDAAAVPEELSANPFPPQPDAATAAEDQAQAPDAAAAAEAAPAPPAPAPPRPAGASSQTRAASSEGAEQAPPSFFHQLRQMLSDPTLGAGLRAVLGLFIFLAGWLIARSFSRGVLSLSRRLLSDPRVVETLGFGSLAVSGDAAGPDEAPPRRVDEIVAQAVYYLLLLLVAIAVLEIAGAAESSGKLRHVLDMTTRALPLVGRALLTLVVTFVIGRVLQKATVRFLQSIHLDRRFGAGAGAAKAAAKATPPPLPADVLAPESLDGGWTSPSSGGKPAATPAPPAEARLSERIGLITFWLIMTFGLLSALEALQIGQLSGPLRQALEKMTDFLPALGAAALIMLGGYLLGRIGRLVVRNLLEAAGFNRLMTRLQLDKPFKKTTPAQAMGQLTMIFFLVQAGIAALNQLELRTLSNPLTGMMTKLYSALPALGLAIILVGVGVLAGRLVRGWIAAVLKNMGFDRLMDRIGLGRLRGSAEGLALPSDVLAFAGQVAIFLLAAAQALEALHLLTWAGYVDAILAFAVERLAVALLIVVIGFGVGTYVREVILARRQADNAETISWIAGAARWAVLVFAFTVAIHQLGVAEHFVRTAFMLLFGSLCLALALALGLGGREVASEIVRRQFERTRKPEEAPRHEK